MNMDMSIRNRVIASTLWFYDTFGGENFLSPKIGMEECLHRLDIWSGVIRPFWSSWGRNRGWTWFLWIVLHRQIWWRDMYKITILKCYFSGYKGYFLDSVLSVSCLHLLVFFTWKRKVVKVIKFCAGKVLIEDVQTTVTIYHTGNKKCISK